MSRDKNHPRVMDYQELKAFTMNHVRDEVLHRMMAKGISSRRLSRLSNVAYTVVLSIVNDGADIRISTAARLATGLSCKLTDLLPSELP